VSQAVKIHTLPDVKTQIPCFMPVTPASTNDIKAMEYIPFDKGYNSFADLYRIHRLGAFFVFRAMNKLNFSKIYALPCD
jgi:hypothetical protein